MHSQNSGIDAAEKTSRIPKIHEETTAVTLMEGIIWGLVLMLPVLWHIVER